MSLWHMGLAEFRDQTASDSPTPGGGSAAMVGASIGLGLVLMALRITARKADDPAAIDPLLTKGERLLSEMAQHADADAAVFETYMQALRLPKETEEEKAERRKALAKATEAATEVPLNGAQSIVEGLDLAVQAADLASTHVASDVGAGAAMLHGAATAVLYNVDINVASVKDANEAASYRQSRAHLQQSADERAAKVRKAMAAALG
jgi:formiminotetrahydrofolate cyclodeaminase